MDKLEEMQTKYEPIINEIITSNSKFNGFTNKLTWKYKIYDNPCKFATCEIDGSLVINPVAIEMAEKLNQILNLEYFIMHEIRHSYQRRLIDKNYGQNIKHPLTEQWLYEFKHSIDPDKDLIGYYNQLTELDAFAFSYAVMKYKYQNLEYINPPQYYQSNKTFIQYVQKYLEFFNANNF